ncbi:MAG: hypothetical protein JWR18_3702 [Segetibacter sp.]|jgi:hypothetical protein|nr:hypothetical protein [Segetibacter sp.]
MLGKVLYLAFLVLFGSGCVTHLYLRTLLNAVDALSSSGIGLPFSCR